jgi:hypothetical protein
MDALTLFGLSAVSAMLIFYALEDHSPWYILAFAGACVLASIYGFLQGAGPFGVIEAIWAVIDLRRWQMRMRATALGVDARRFLTRNIGIDGQYQRPSQKSGF